ncbi:UDP-2,4-diacetamido-2,4,6-trideoxy-beta-L-altropyranose hydrolase [Calidifontibacillus oryziterrae]|uniref:UDP-2,4-diacetamido-2,4, 6-trideoxy-beta-L-altropyranose hydrolase n=1 Tax=Calidifontibacillus oryziterrae TaxID=1191699 RepID=UPI0003002774|nr:UDP-2,4-diacetamido-2,4,6-trideoxy-beta-L-altropyranose hydrolase [Calidifontibacillus oryziterrae]
MNIFIRVDASITIGTGHVMRCLTLAHYLKEIGAKVIFICKETKGNLIEFIISEGFLVKALSERNNIINDANVTKEILMGNEADLLIIDHYQIDYRWERIIKKAFLDLKVMVIDDLANRQHDCDLLLDQNFFINFNNRYEHLVPDHCRKLLGPHYLLLRPEFYTKNNVVEIKQPIQNILIFYGGSDPTNETLKVIKAMDILKLLDVTVHVVVGLSNTNRELIRRKCEKSQYKFYLQIDYMADLMRMCDLALGAGGVTMWERCFLGLPSIVTVVAENQQESTEAAAMYGAVWNLGWHENVKTADLVDIINRVINQPNVLQKMSEKSLQLMHAYIVKGNHPVVQEILEVLKR